MPVWSLIHHKKSDFSELLRETEMPEWSLIYLKKSDFGGMRSRKGKRKPNQHFVYDIAIQCFDFPRGPHFNKFPAQLILEIFKYLQAYELLRKVSLVCKYWYNLCMDRAIWTSITWNGTPRTLGYLLQLTKYQVHELVLTNNLFMFSDNSLACSFRKCTHLKCLKLPTNACIELFKRELPRTNILGGISLFHAKNTEIAGTSAKDIEIALASGEHKRCYTLEEFREKHKKLTYTQLIKTDNFLPNRRLVRVDDKIMKTPDRPCIRKCPLQDCRTMRRQHQPIKIKPRPPKGRNNHHKEVKRFRGLQKRFKMFSLT